MDNDKVKLYEFILDQYSSLSELKDLCFYLGVTYDDLEGGARKEKARELVEHITRRKRLDDLRAVLNQQRPDDYRAAFPVAPAVPVAAPIASTTRRNPRQIFISHATADSAFAHRLAADLRRDGFDIWIAPESIHPGEQWVRAINRGLEESGVMVLVLTPAAAASPWVEMETNVAIQLERKKQLTFIPVLLEDGNYPLFWQMYQWVMEDGDYAARLAALRARLNPRATGSNPDRRIHEKTGVELIRIPAGPFLYGDDKRTIELPEYWIGRTPVTNAQYKRFLDANPDHPVPFVDADWAKPYNWDAKQRMYSPKGEHPVVLVSWQDAKAFCDWAGLALPSEQQWEKAARGTDGRRWPWGDDPPTETHCNFGKTIGATTAVGQYSPIGDSPYGCADTAGNVWEWTASLLKEGDDWRVMRGGSWSTEAEACRCALRTWTSPFTRPDYLGFRVLVAPS